jgi:hypothetical protein
MAKGNNKKKKKPTPDIFSEKIIIVTKTTFPPGKTMFPEKLEKANDMLRRTKFLDKE